MSWVGVTESVTGLNNYTKRNSKWGITKFLGE